MNEEILKERLTQIMLKFSGKSDTAYIIRGNTITAESLLNILECSLNAQKEELDRLKKTAKQQAKSLETLSQGQLL